jgi:hypothetical protein
MRDDKKYRQKIDETLQHINVTHSLYKGEVRKLAHDKAR